MPSSYFTTGKEKIRELMMVASGSAEADLAVVNGDVVNVYTGEIMKNHTVLVKGDTIAYVGRDGTGAIGNSTRIIDAGDKVVVPGFIDGHTHVDDQFRIDELVKYALPGNTTTIITETSGVGSIMGYRGIIEFAKALGNQPVRFFLTIPPVISVSPSINRNSVLVPAEIKRLLRRKDVVGTGEISWAQVNDEMLRLYELIAGTINAGKRVDGHSAGARNNKLQAYFATGISSCHEPVTAEEVLERLRLGVLVLIREGVVRKELDAVYKIKDEKIDFRNLAISSDGIDPGQLVSQGYMDFIVQKVINYGFDPVLAIQMVTVNVARHFGLDFIGGIAPGKLADMAVIPDLRAIRAETVIAGGKIAVSGGQLVIAPRRHRYPGLLHKTVHLTRDLTADDFTIRINADRAVKLRVIDQVSDLLTKEAAVEMTVTDGVVKADVGRDILEVAVIDRYWQPGKLSLGMIRGFGLKHGAAATSTGWDSGHIVVVGTSGVDMAQAVNRIRELQGGIVICAGGTILAEIAMPVMGIFSEDPMTVITAKYDCIQKKAAELGTGLKDIHMSLQILTTPSIPFLRMNEEGLFDLKNNRPLDLIAV